MNRNVSKKNCMSVFYAPEKKENYAKLLMLTCGKEQIYRSWSLSLLSPMSQQPYSMILVACTTEDRAASSPGVTWHAVLVWFNASAGDANLFCLWLSFAVGCLSLFLNQIKLDGFHNCVSATLMLENTEKLHNMWHTHAPKWCLSHVRGQHSLKEYT